MEQSKREVAEEYILQHLITRARDSDKIARLLYQVGTNRVVRGIAGIRDEPLSGSESRPPEMQCQMLPEGR